MFDPWIIADRDAISVALLNCTRVPAVFGEDNLGNSLWGIRIQTQWQINSGRQQSQSNAARIDENSWFANINYLLTIVPYLVAMKCQLLPTTTKFLPPQVNPASDYPIVYADIDPAIAEDWTNYFETIKRLRSDPTYVSLESLQQILWVVHNSTVVEALVKFAPKLNSLNIKEKKFSNGFGHLVEILAIVNMDTSYTPTNSLNKMLPQRKLTFWDTPPLIFDMTAQQNVVVSSLFGISDITEVDLLWNGLLNALRTGMSATKCAGNLTQTIGDFFMNPRENFLDLLSKVLGSLTCAF